MHVYVLKSETGGYTPENSVHAEMTPSELAALKIIPTVRGTDTGTKNSVDVTVHKGQSKHPFVVIDLYCAQVPEFAASQGVTPYVAEYTFNNEPIPGCTLRIEGDVEDVLSYLRRMAYKWRNLNPTNMPLFYVYDPSQADGDKLRGIVHGESMTVVAMVGDICRSAAYNVT